MNEFCARYQSNNNDPGRTLSAAPVEQNLRAEDSWPVGFLALDPPCRRQPGMAVLSAVMGKEQISVRGSVTLIEIVE